MIMGYCSDKVIPVKSSLFRGIKVCAVFNDLTWRHADIPYDTQKKETITCSKGSFQFRSFLLQKKDFKDDLESAQNSLITVHLRLCLDFASRVLGFVVIHA